MKKLSFVVCIGTLSLALAACEDNDDDYTPPSNNTVVTNDADECPRADGQPCK